VITSIDRQSGDISMGVDTGGAGDQGLMFGFACDETPELMPLSISLAHGLCRRLTETRRSGELPFLRPDGKTQVTLEFEGDRPARVEAVVVSSQHDDKVTVEQMREPVLEQVVRKVVPRELLDARTKFFVNPTGRFVVGGPQGDTGLTGRKIIVDTYGGVSRHGGGAFSGKDPSKVDRSASYMARHIAKNIVAAGLARRAEVQVAYAIGVAEPVSVRVDTFGTGNGDGTAIAKAVRELFPLTPRGIIDYLKLRRPIYLPTAAYGHFGREGEGFTWERTDRAEDLRAAVRA
jgi:S-adenosylmethionine synthetase